MHAEAEQGRGVAEVAARETLVELDGLQVRLCQAAELERYVDRDALLGAEAAPEPPYWMHLWPGATAAARMVAASSKVAGGARVLELGCGLGLPALAAALRGATVLASDWQEAPLRFLRRSAALNGCRVDLVRMDWTAPALRGRFAVCIGADIAYDAAAEPGLAAALRELLEPAGVVWLADSVNTARRSLLERLAAGGFTVAERQVREWEEGRPVWVRIIEARRR